MANYVLVHGGDVSTETWNKLTGKDPILTDNGRLGWRVWEKVVSILQADDHEVYAPTLENEYITNLSGHIGQVVEIINKNNLADVILVGHSYGGMVITGIANMIPEKLKHLVYVDAALPDPGQSLYDVIYTAEYNPNAINGLDPAPAYTEKLQFDPQKIKNIPKTFIKCTKSEVAAVIDVIINNIKSDGGKWKILELPTVHVFQATMPEEFARMLLEIQ